MAQVTDSDIKELKDLIQELIKENNTRLTALESRMSALELGQVKIEGRISAVEGRLTALESNTQKIPDLAEKVGELKNWKQIGLTLIGTVIGGVVTYLGRSSNH
jgi:predicted nuclease with TOPRIM domain